MRNFSNLMYLDNFVEILNKVYWDKNFMIYNSMTKIKIYLQNQETIFNVLTIETHTDKFVLMKKAMLNHYKNFSTNNIHIQDNLIKKISSLNMVVGILTCSNNEMSDSLVHELLKLSQAVDGLIFADGKDLLDPNGKIILDAYGNSELSKYFI